MRFNLRWKGSKILNLIFSDRESLLSTAANPRIRAFSGEVDTGWPKENVTKQEDRVVDLIQSDRKPL